METAGTLTARMIVDSTQAKQSLNNVNALLNVTKKNFVQLGRDASRATEELGVKTRTLTEDYRAFLREQRFQNRVMREGRDAVMGVAFAFMMLSNQGEDNSVIMERVSKGLMGFIAGMNAAEFSVFSLGRALSASTGLVAAFGRILQASAGWIGLVVGAGAALIGFFSQTKAEAKQAAEETKKYNEELNKLIDFADKLGNVSELTEEDRRKSVEVAKKEYERLQKQIEVYNRYIDTIRNGERDKTFVITDAEMKIVDVQKELLGKNLKDIESARDEKIKLVQKYYAFIFEQEQRAIKPKTKKEIEEEAKKQLEEQRKLNEQREKIIKESNERQLKERQELANKEIELEEQLNSALITNKYDKERYEAEQELLKKKADIDEIVNALYEGEERIAERKRLYALADKEYQLKIAEIIKEERLENENKIRREQLETLDQLRSGLMNLSDILNDSGRNFVRQLMIALDIVQKIIELQSKKEEINFGDIFNVATLVLKFLSGFQSGGYTGRGASTEPAGIVHRGEIVFEKPIVDKFGSQLMALRNQLKSYSDGGYVGVDSGLTIANTALINEVRNLRQQNAMLVEEMQRLKEMPIVIEAQLDSMRFFKKEYEKYDYYQRQKKV